MGNSILFDTFSAANLLATVDGKEYRTLEIVYERNGTGTITPYCAQSEWKASPVGQLAAKDAEIAVLRAEVEGLRVRLLEMRSVPIPTEEALATTVTVPAHTQDTLMCPECGQGPFLTRKGWMAHRRIKHGVQARKDA